MALRKRGDYWYGDSQEDIRPELIRYSQENGYPIDHFADCVCVCGNRHFTVEIDDAEGAAIRHCRSCEKKHPIGDSEEFLADAELEECSCLCKNDIFEITVGVSLYDHSEDVHWLYLGCRCIECGLLGSYGDWKNEFNGYQLLLKKV